MFCAARARNKRTREAKSDDEKGVVRYCRRVHFVVDTAYYKIRPTDATSCAARRARGRNRFPSHLIIQPSTRDSDGNGPTRKRQAFERRHAGRLGRVRSGGGSQPDHRRRVACITAAHSKRGVRVHPPAARLDSLLLAGYVHASTCPRPRVHFHVHSHPSQVNRAAFALVRVKPLMNSSRDTNE